MTNYINQLIDDIRKAAESLPTKPFMELLEDEECLRGVMEYETVEPKPMHEWFGIHKTVFPPADRLTKDQLKIMVDEILKLWAAYNFEATLPDKLPADIAYTTLVNHFDKPVIWISEGIIGIEFCSNEPDNCPFPVEFCMCKDFEGDDSFDNSSEIAHYEKEIKEFLSDTTKKFQPAVEYEKYVGQHILDLNTHTERIKQQLIIPDNIGIRSARDHKLLVEGSFITLENLSGIKASTFPEHIYLDGIQIQKLLIAMLKMLDVYRIKVHQPNDIPPEWSYETLIESWDTALVKHLPDSGFDLELCTGDPMTCPYGMYCDCGDETDLLDEDDFSSNRIDFDDDNDELPF